MTNSDALEIIQMLASGNCAETGEPLPPGSQFLQPHARMALEVAIKAMERVERIERRAGEAPSLAGQGWDSAEEELLRDRFAQGQSIAALAQAHQRSKGAIQSRLMRLGLIAQR